MKDIHQEKPFEDYIAEKLHDLTAPGHGWRESMNDTGFDPSTALYMPDFIEYQEAVEPDKIEKMKKMYGKNWKSNLTKQLVKSLENDGTILTLRNGFQLAGFQTIHCSGHYPDDPRLKDQKKFYDANILRVMHQVHYQTAGNMSIDLVFFINGIPVATAEVKTELTQTVYDAIDEYQKYRKPIEPKTKRKNYLLMYKRGAVVHFAISEDEIWMCTNLNGDKPRFLPFNRGNFGHAGNPPMKAGDTDYPTGYFWNDICQKDNWLRIFHNFVFEEVENKEDVTGRVHPVKAQIFPRFHQWDCVTQCIDDVKKNGVGQKYLIEHSAGSGKTETITWIAHELIRLREADGEREFSSVIVVTDRVGLDNNIKKTIKQLKKTVGLIAMIGGGDGQKKISKAKSKQLSEALHDKREIIVVTLQTFPFALEAIASDEALVGAKFAVLIDEAHSSQTGKFSAEMKAALKLAAKEDKSISKNMEEVTDEDAIDAYFAQIQASHVMPNNVSFFAFTATPKTETKVLFGRPGKRIDSKTGQAIPESFHLYPMRQAIEEHYILDVLKGYIPYKTAFKLREDVVKDAMVDKKTALRTIAQWATLHPTNVMGKTMFIIEHFVKNVAPMLNGQAKAMIVTSSRASVVRYKYAIEGYLKVHPELDRNKLAENLRFKVPGEPLVAFSGKVKGSDAVMPEDAEHPKVEVISEDAYLSTNPFAEIKTDYDYTEANMNNLGYATIENAFDESDRRLLIVADKFQTGFNQPKLCAMYIDKKMSNDIEIVQTYSRVNRIHSGKDKVFIVDFVNDPETIVRAFKKYDQGAEMEEPQDLNIIYQLKSELDNADIYTQDDFETYKKVRYQSVKNIGNNNSVRLKLYRTVSEPASRWLDAVKATKTAYKTWQSYRDTAERDNATELVKNADRHLDAISDELDNLMNFRKKLKKYVSAYGYISQIIDLGEPDLEVFAGFAQLLSHRIAGTPLEDIDVSNLVLSDFRINKLDYTVPGPDDEEAGGKPVLKPMRAGGKGRSSNKEESLKAIIAHINQIWGDDIPTTTGARTINAIADYVTADDVSRTQIRNSTNSKESIIADGRLRTIIRMAAIALKSDDFATLADKVLTDPQALEPLAKIIYDLVNNNQRIDMQDLSIYLKNHKK